MTAVWPSTLPRPMRQGYQASPTEARMKRRTEAGFPGYRRRFSSVAETVAMTIEVDRNERGIFDNFYRDTTANGTLPFFMPDPTTHGWALYATGGQRLLTASGQPLVLAARWLCLFGDALPATTVIGLRFRISFDVLVMP